MSRVRSVSKHTHRQNVRESRFLTGTDEKRTRARMFRNVALFFALTRIYHVLDPRDRDRRLGDVRRKHHLACTFGRRLEDLRLQVGRHLRVDGEHSQWRMVIKLRQPFCVLS